MADVAAARAEQVEMARRVVQHWDGPEPRLVAGVDLAGGTRGRPLRAAAVSLAWPSLDREATAVVEEQPTFPYVPGLLALREAPAALRVLAQLPTAPDVLMVDGHGVAHPRRCGIACYLGLTLDTPTIGVAKSRLVGTHDEPGPAPGDATPLLDAGEVIGMVVRTRVGSKPLYISVGHRVDLATAVRLVLAATRGHRLPEPTHQADWVSRHDA